MLTVLRLENIQRRATESVQGMKYLSYRDRLNYLGLTCLEIRRKRGDLVFMWKYINGITTIRFNRPNIYNPHQISLRGNSSSLLPHTNKPPKTRLRNNFFTERIVRMWSELPDEVDTAPSISTFKGRLDFYWMLQTKRCMHPTTITSEGCLVIQPIVYSHFLLSLEFKLYFIFLL